MISWLLTSSSEYPDLVSESSVLQLLSPAEVEVLSRFRLPKRRREWLLGRWTAKRLLGDWWAEQSGHRPDWRDWSILADSDGAPAAFLTGEGRLPISLSISHRDNRAFCALAEAPAFIGADIERVETHSDAFVRDFFTSAEQDRVEAAVQSGGLDLKTLVTLIWSGKEAVLKVARTGLREDTRAVEVLPRWPGGGRTESLPGSMAWYPLSVTCRLSGLDQVRVWWRQSGDYILTLAAIADEWPGP